jgi:hypothetical protein
MVVENGRSEENVEQRRGRSGEGSGTIRGVAKLGD